MSDWVIDFDRHADPTDARFRLAAATRLVIDELARSNASDDAFEQACTLVEQAVALVRARPHGRIYQNAEASLADFQASGSILDFSPVVGALNPLAPPIAMSHDGERGLVIGDVVYPDAYEGPPGCVHGGFIAAGFDEVLGLTQSMSGSPGMTGRLEVSYRSPTPLGRPVRFVGRLDRVDGRKLFVSATLHHGETLCAEAQGLFISMKHEVFERLMRSRDDGRQTPEIPPAP